jgi:predicted nucleic acid-binding protein
MTTIFLDTSFIIALELVDEQYQDCISFLVMNRLNIQLVLTFDKHFSQAGYQKLPI